MRRGAKRIFEAFKKLWGKFLRMDSGANLTITNLTLTNANEKYPFKLPPWTRCLSIQGRPSVELHCFSDQNSSDYFTIYGEAAYFETDIIFSGTLWFSSSMAGVVVEIITWNIKV